MSYTIERKNNPPSYIITLNEDFDLKTELIAYFKELTMALESESKPISVVVSMLNYSLSLSELMTATKDMMSMDVNPYQDPNVKHVIMVSTDKLLRFSVDGFIKFGIVKTIKTADTVEEALTLV